MNDRRSLSPDRGYGNSLYNSSYNSTLEDMRQKALDSLTDAFAQGDIEVEEYELRAATAQRARSSAELDSCLQDLPQGGARLRDVALRGSLRGVSPRGSAASSGSAPAARHDRLPDMAAGAAGEFSLCIMSERHLASDWLASERAHSVTLMGSTTIDLRDSPLVPGKTKINVYTVMGETRIIVPKGLRVKLSAFPVMGEASMDRTVTPYSSRSAEPDEAWVEIAGLALMSELSIVAKD